MRSFTHIYKKMFKKSLTQYGFKLYRRTFYRVVNDVVQMLMLSNWDCDYTIEYDIQPLCLGVQDLKVAGYSIHNFRTNSCVCNNKSWDLWSCELTGEKPSEEVMTKYVDEMLSIVHTHVIPIFNKLKKSEFWFDDWSKRVNVDHSGLIYLKAGDYDNALITMKKAKKQCEDTLKKYHADPCDPYGLKRLVDAKVIKKSDLDMIHEKHIASEKKMLEEIERFTLMIALLSNQEMDYFNNIYAENEKKSREYLRNPSIYKHKNGY